MRKFFLGIAVVFTLCAFGITGCGGHKEAVIEPSNEGGLTAEDQQGYEEYMKQQSGKAGPSGS